MLSFRGALFAEESLFYWTQTEERFLTSFGMTIKGTFSAACFAAGVLELKLPRSLAFDNRQAINSSRLTRDINFERVDITGNPFTFTASHHFQVISRLQVQPKCRRGLEVARQP